MVFELTQGDERQEVRFQIDVSNSSPFVEIDEKILVNFGLVTRIEKISNEIYGRVLAQLKTINADDPQLENVLEPMRKEIQAPVDALREILHGIGRLRSSCSSRSSIDRGLFECTQRRRSRLDPTLAFVRNEFLRERRIRPSAECERIAIRHREKILSCERS